MSFHIPKIEKPIFYLDVAFKRAQKVQKKNARKKQMDKLVTIHDYLLTTLDRIVTRFPQIEELHPFYKELFKASIEFGKVKKCLGAVIWAKFQVKKFTKIYTEKMRYIDPEKKDLLNKFRAEYYGRISSVLNQIKKELAFLDESRKILAKFPIVKTGMKTVCITGFPNVGKTTLLYKLTGSKGDIQDYAFTTKGLNVSYKDDIQYLDTPGALNRKKLNIIEFTAYLAMEHLGNVLIYIFDPTETYDVQDQVKLLKNIKKYKKKMLIYVSKTDIEHHIPPEFKKFKLLSLTEIKKELKELVPLSHDT